MTKDEKLLVKHAKKGDLAIMGYYLGRVSGSIAELRDKDGNNIAHWLAKNGNRNLIEIAVKENHLDLKARNSHSERPIHWAVKGGQLEIINYFKKCDIEFDVKDQSNKGVLHYAAAARKEKFSNKVVLTLIQNKADVNCQTSFSQVTPLHVAVENNNIEMIRILLNNNADPKITRNNGHTPLEDAREKDNVEMIELLGQQNFPKQTYSDDDMSAEY